MTILHKQGKEEAAQLRDEINRYLSFLDKQSEQSKTVLRFIERFSKRDGKELGEVTRCFTDGCCWWFARILCERFVGEMVYDEIDGHFAAEIGGRVYDITGDITETFRKTYWSVFVEREPNLSVRILRRCREFEEGI